MAVTFICIANTTNTPLSTIRTSSSRLLALAQGRPHSTTLPLRRSRKQKHNPIQTSHHPGFLSASVRSINILHHTPPFNARSRPASRISNLQKRQPATRRAERPNQPSQPP